MQPMLNLAYAEARVLQMVEKKNTKLLTSFSKATNLTGCASQVMCCCRQQQQYAADVRIASQGWPSSPSEALSFGAYDSASAFQSHASLTAQPNGTLDVLSSDLNMLPSQGTAAMGSGQLGMQFFQCVFSLPCINDKIQWQPDMPHVV